MMTMKSSGRLRGLTIAIVILIVSIPAAVTVTLAASSFWLWFEQNTGIEAYGHSGPADWCYLVAYVLIVAICTWIWSRIKNNKLHDK